MAERNAGYNFGSLALGACSCGVGLESLLTPPPPLSADEPKSTPLIPTSNEWTLDVSENALMIDGPGLEEWRDAKSFIPRACTCESEMVEVVVGAGGGGIDSAGVIKG
eukprot:12426439-Karenia_brevis.AAC.1